MSEDLQLHEDLAALAGQVRTPPLDVAGLQATARRRVRRRRLLAAGPAVLAVLGGLLLLPALTRPAPDRLTVAAAAEPVRVSVTATLRQAVDGVSLRSATGPVAVTGHETVLSLVWAVDVSTVPAPLPGPVPGLFEQVRADDGPGVIGVTDGRCAYWDDLGRAVPHSCPPTGPAPAPVTTGPAPAPVTTGTTSTIVVSDVAGSGRMAPGTYRFAFDPGRLGTVDVVLTVTGTRRPPEPAPVPVTGLVTADHGRGPVLVGHGPVPATLTFRRVRSGDTTRVTTTDGRWSTTLPPGGYQVTVEIADGGCPGYGLDVAAGTPTTLDITCSDGASTS